MSDNAYVSSHGPTVSGDVVVRPDMRRRISWGGVFAGLFLVLAIQLLLSLLGFGIGLSMVQPGQGGAPNAGAIGIGAAVWWVVTYLIALVLGGFTAARLAGVARRFDGVLHGLVTWAFALLVTFYLLTTAVGGVIGGAFGVVGHVLSGAGQGLKAVAPEVTKAAGISPDQIRQQSKELLQPTDPSKMSNEQAAAQIAKNVGVYLAGGSGAQQARNRIVAIMAAKLGISKDEAGRRFDQWISHFNKTKSHVVQGAKQTAGQAADVLSQASIWAFVALLLGAIFSGIGGAWGTQPRIAVVESERIAS
jgi:hypothetical protein